MLKIILSVVVITGMISIIKTADKQAKKITRKQKPRKKKNQHTPKSYIDACWNEVEKH